METRTRVIRKIGTISWALAMVSTNCFKTWRRTIRLSHALVWTGCTLLSIFATNLTPGLVALPWSGSPSFPTTGPLCFSGSPAGKTCPSLKFLGSRTAVSNMQIGPLECRFVFMSCWKHPWRLEIPSIGYSHSNKPYLKSLPLLLLR